MNFSDILMVLGVNKYTPASICLLSDYVLVRMFTLMQTFVGVCALLMAILLFVCYRNGANMLKIAVVILKDPWLLKLLALNLLLYGINQIIAAITIHYAIYNVRAVTLAFLAGVSVYTIVRFLTIAFDQTRQASLLDDVLSNGSGDIPNYTPEPVDGCFTVAKPLPLPAASGKAAVLPSHDNTEKE